MYVRQFPVNANLLNLIILRLRQCIAKTETRNDKKAFDCFCPGFHDCIYPEMQ